MEVIRAKKIKIERLKEEFRKYLTTEAKIKSSNTINTYSSDAFKLQREDSKAFWRVLQSSDFENDAKEEFEKRGLGASYLSSLRTLKKFIELSEIPEDDEEASLKDFLLDINCLHPVTEWIEKVNLFGVLKISTMEIKHSNMLAWLLDPNEKHGFGDGILKGVIRYYLKSSNEGIEVFRFLLGDLFDFDVRTEVSFNRSNSKKDRIDILATSNALKLLICIENKTKSTEHDDQLDRYREDLEKKYPDFSRWLLYLTPHKEDAQDLINWVPIGYQDILDIIKEEKGKVALSSESAILVGHYEDTITRDLVGDDELEKICQRIYDKHQIALELIKHHKTAKDSSSNMCRQIMDKYQKEIDEIMANRKDRCAQAAAIFREWAQNKADDKENKQIVFDDRWSNKRYTRFTTKRMTEILPDVDSISDWGTRNFYFYEIYSTDGKSYSMKFELNSKDLPDTLKSDFEKIISEFSKKGSVKDNWRYCQVYSTESSTLVETQDVPSQKDEIFVQLDQMLEQVLNFESQVYQFFKESEAAAREETNLIEIG